MAKVIDIQSGQITTNNEGGFFLTFPHPFSEGYIIEFRYDGGKACFIHFTRRDALGCAGSALKITGFQNAGGYNHKHNITLSACASGHANCVASSPTGGPDVGFPTIQGGPLGSYTIDWVAIGT